MDLFDVSVVNFGFRRAQRFKDLYRAIFCRLADLRGLNDLANFFQPAMRVRVLRSVFMLVTMAMLMRMAVLVGVAVVMPMLMWRRRPRRCMGMRVIVAVTMLMWHRRPRRCRLGGQSCCRTDC